jgi:hypothetical protein
MADIKKRVICKELDKNYNTLFLANEFSPTLLAFFVYDMENSQRNSHVQNTKKYLGQK